jgi:N-acetylmuramoyl-L-alanine amidase
VKLKKDLTRLGFGNFPSSPSQNYGSVTEGVVKDFQRYYGLSVTGIGDERTLRKIEEILNSPYSDGQSGNHVVTLKENLTLLGFGNFPSSPSSSYGSVTEGVVKEFQKANGLAVNGIADTVTLAKIEELLNDITLYGTITGVTTSLNVRSGPGTSHGVIDSLSNGTQVEILSSQSNGWLRISYNGGNTGYVSGQYVDVTGTTPPPNSAPPATVNSGTVVGVSSSLNVRSGPGTNHSAIGSLARGANVDIRKTERNGWLQISYNGSVGYVSGQYISLDVPSSGALSGKVIMLDPGHGAHDPGAIAGGMRESDLVLDISLRAQRLLQNQGATVLMTRTTDVFHSLSQRASMANNSNADIFISVHANAFNGSANGTETFWNSRYQSANSEKLANTLQNATVQKMGTTYRRVAQQNFTVITSTRIPSALLEVGFMDHSGDAAKLRQSSYRDRSAEAIVEGVINYFR